MYTEQIQKGQAYDVFKKCISINILNFTLFPKDTEFYSCFRILEETRHTLYTDKMEFHVLELPKLPKELTEDSNRILLWAKFINAERKEDFEMLAKKDVYIDHAYQQLQRISQDKEKRLEYEAREKAIRDYNQMIQEAEQRGEQRGIECGMERGMECGIERICKLHNLLIQNGRYEDLARSSKDSDYRNQLLKEYKI